MALSFRKFWEGIRLVAKAATSSTTKGDLEVLDPDSKIYYHNGTINSPLLTEDGTATIENKTIVVADNIFVTVAAGNLVATELNAALAELDSDIDDIESDLAAHLADTVGAHAASAISNIPSGNLAATDVQSALNELQTDINTKVTSSSVSSVDNHLVVWDSTTGNVIQDSSVAVLSDAGALSGLTQLDVDNIRIDGNVISSTNTDGTITLTPNGTGNIGLGAVPSVSRFLTVTGPTDDEVSFRFKQFTANTSTNTTIGDFLVQTSGDMIDGFGMTTNYLIRDSAAVENVIAQTSVSRDGADNSGKIDFKVRNAGASVTGITIRATGVINIPNLTASLPVQTDASKNLISAAINLSNAQTTGINTLAKGGTNKNMTAVAGAVVWTDADSMEVSAAGTTGQYLVSGGTGSPTWSTVTPGDLQIATIKDIKAAGTQGGTFTSGSFQTRTLNTLDDPAGIVTSLVANQFVLPAGTYFIEAYAPAQRVQMHKAKLRNITDSTDDLNGTNEYCEQSGTSADARVSTKSMIIGEITLAGSKTFEIQHRCSITSEATAGFGQAVSFGLDEVYTVVKITKV